MHPHLERLKDLYSEFGPVLILDPTTRDRECYAGWVNQGIRWAKTEGLDALIWSNDDIGPTTDTIGKLIDALAYADLVSQRRGDNNWDFSADLFGIRITHDQLWMDESYGFHWADLDMALRARVTGRRHELIDISYDMAAYVPVEPKGHLSEFHRHEAADVKLRDARWGWLLHGTVKHP
jgi:hypothetical protein